MAKLTLKALLGVGGASVACATSFGIFYGLKNNSGLVVQSNSFISPTTGSSDTNPEEVTYPAGQQVAQCTDGEDSVGAGIPHGMHVSQEDIAKLKVRISENGSCNFDLQDEAEEEEGEEDEEDDDLEELGDTTYETLGSEQYP